MRLCPSVEGSASPLITHRIGVDVCQARQSNNFHKCHRCVYRGQHASWEPESSPLPMLNLYGAEPARDIEVKTVPLPRQLKKATKAAAAAKGSKSAASKTAQAAS